MIAHPTLAASTFAFGDVVVRFESDDRDWLSFLERRYPWFGTDDGMASFVIRFESKGAPPAGLVSPLAVNLENVRIEPTDSGFELETPTTQASVDLNAARATLTGPSAMYPLDNLLRHLLPVLWRLGALFHGAAITGANGEDGLLACGPSGAGKSTLARLFGERALCDELAGMRRAGNAPYRLVSLPFWASRPGEARLAAVLLLEHGAEHRLTTVSPGDAIRELSQLLLWPTARESAMEDALGQLSRLVTDVRVLRLSFVPRADVRPFLEKELL